MIEAVLIAVVAVAYAEIVSILSMVVSVFVGSVMGLVTLAHVLVVIIFIGGAFGFMGWVKQKMANPLVNVGSTLASLAIISVITKENAVISNVFSNQKIVQVFKMLIMGITSTAAVNVLIWRVSARDLLRTSVAKSSASLGGMLSAISGSFLKGAEDEQMSAEFSASSATYTVTYPQMLKNLREAKFEDYLLGREKIYVLQRSTVKAIETLARSIGGLRSAANTQLSLLKEAESDDVPPPLTRFLTASSLGDFESIRPRSSSPRLTQAASRPGSSSQGEQLGMSTHDQGPTPSSLFLLFVDLIGPSMEALTQSLNSILQEPPLGTTTSYEATISDELRQQLTDALGQFNMARADALQQVYTMIEREKSTSRRIQAGLEEVAAACGHFSFSLQKFGEEMQKYLDVLDDLKYVSEHSKQSWRWLLWWRKEDASAAHGRKMSSLPFETSPEAESLIRPIRKRDMPRGIPDSIIRRRDTYNWQAAPNASKVLSTISQSIMRFARKIARDDSK